MGDESFSTLVLPRVSAMPVQTLRLIREFCRGGGRVVAVESLPNKSCGLGNEQANAEAEQIAEGLFGEMVADTQGQAQHAFGQGKVFFFSGPSALTGELATAKLSALVEGRVRMEGPLEEALARHIIESDFSVDPPSPSIHYLHRRVNDKEVYFVCNHAERVVAVTATFSASGTPSFWNTETGTVEDAYCYLLDDRGCSLPLRLEGYGSTVVVFENLEEKAHVTATNACRITGLSQGRCELSVECLVERNGPFFVEAAHGSQRWRGDGLVSELPPAFSLPVQWRWSWDSHSEERTLASWTERPGLEFWSGAMRYSNEFVLPESYSGKVLVLDLGNVRDIAEIWVNDQHVATRCWRPFRTDVSSFAHHGSNKVDILVTNTLGNERDGKPYPSGLLGPATLVPYEFCSGVTLKLAK